MTPTQTVTLAVADWQAIVHLLGELPTRTNVWPLLQRVQAALAPAVEVSHDEA